MIHRLKSGICIALCATLVLSGVLPFIPPSQDALQEAFAEEAPVQLDSHHDDANDLEAGEASSQQDVAQVEGSDELLALDNTEDDTFSERADFLGTNDYQDIFDLNIATPEAFVDTADPLEEYVPLEATEIYMAKMNRFSAYSGDFRIMDNADILANLRIGGSNGLEEHTLGTATQFLHYNSDGNLTTGNNNKKGFDYNTQNAVPVDLNGDGIDDALFQVVIYTGLHGTNVSKKAVSQMQLMVYYQNDESYAHGTELLVPLVDDSTNNKDAFSAIETQNSLGFKAMAVGDYDNDGVDEVAVYVPTLAGKGDPYIGVYEVHTKDYSISEKQRISLSNLNIGESQFSFDFKDHLVPMVHLATTKISGKEELVINASLPLHEKDGYCDKEQRAVIAIYKWGSAQGTEQFLESFRTALSHPSDTNRMRFVQAVDADLNGNGVSELLLGGFNNCNYTDSGKKKVGSLDRATALLNIITWNGSNYELVWASPKIVDTFLSSSKNLDEVKTQEPAALTAGRYLSTLREDGCFIEGAVYYLKNYDKTTTDEADSLRAGNFERKAQMDVKDSGHNNAFINTALSGRFVSTALTEQIIIMSGDENSSAQDKIYYDIWSLSEGVDGNLVFTLTDNNYVENRDEDDDGTFFTLCATNFNEDALKLKYKGKTMGWSSPEPLALVYGAPYWKDLPYNKETFGAGRTSFTIKSGIGSGNEDETSTGGSFVFGFDALIGGGIGQTELLGGMGFDIEDATVTFDSYAMQKDTVTSYTVNVPASEDHVFYMAIPAVVYQYDMQVPSFVATDEYLNAYYSYEGAGELKNSQGTRAQAGDVIPAQTVAFSVTYQYASTFSTATIDDYNAMWQEYYDMSGVDPDPQVFIDNSSIFPHVTGEPLSYPKSVSRIPSIEAESDILGSLEPLKIGTGSATLGFTLEASELETVTGGTQTDFNATIVGKETFHCGYLVKASQSLDVGGAVKSGTRVTDISTSMNGVVFDGEVPFLPEGADAYGFSVGMTAWKLFDDEAQTDDEVQAPYAVGYCVPDEIVPSSLTPPALPENIRIAAVDRGGLMLAWDNPTWESETYFDRQGVRQADAYEIWQLASDGGYKHRATVAASETHWLMTGLEPETSYTYRFIAVRDTTIKSIMSNPITAVTLGNTLPTISRQPQHAVVPLKGGTGIFTVEAVPAHAQDPELLTYQWQQLVGAEWRDVANDETFAGAQTNTLQVTIGSNSALNETSYRVRITEDYKGSFYVATSYSATLYQSDVLSMPRMSLALSADETEGVLLDGQYYCKAGAELSLAVALDSEVDVEVSDFACRVYDYTTGSRLEDYEVSGSFSGNPRTGEVDWGSNVPQGSYTIVAMCLVNKTSVVQSEPLIVNVGQTNPDESYFTLSYDLNGGSNDPANPHVITKASAPFTLEDPVRKGATFKGWIDATGIEVAGPLDPASFTSNQTYTAQWELTKFDLVYEGVNTEESSVNPASYTVESGALTLASPMRAGYEFMGWYLDADFTPAKAITSLPSGMTPQEIADNYAAQDEAALVTGNTLTLYAKWSDALVYSINYMLLGGKDAGSNQPSYTVQDSFVLEPATHAHSGKVFEGWYTDIRFTQPITDVQAGTTGSLTLWAKWVGSNDFVLGLEQDADGIYLIQDAEGLARVAEAVYLHPEVYGSASYRLTAPIDCSGTSWSLPIGTISSPFQGTFDGNDMPLYGLLLETSSKFYDDEDEDESSEGEGSLDEDSRIDGTDNAPGHGLFGVIGSSGVVKNVALLNVQSSSTPNNAGALAIINRGVILHCSNGIYQSQGGMMLSEQNETLAPYKDMESAVSAKNIAGGLVAINGGSIVCSSSAATVTVGEGGLAGGLVGLNRDDGCLLVIYNSGSVQSNGGFAGGLIGSNADEGLAFCGYNAGTLQGGTLGGIAAVSANGDSSALYYNNAALAACSNATLSATAMSLADMKSNKLVEKLIVELGTRGDFSLLKDVSWLRHEFINEGLPLIRSGVVRLESWTVTVEGNKAVSLTGLMHPNAKLVVVPLKDELVLNSFKEAAGVESLLLSAYDVRIVFSDGTDAPYCGVLRIGFDLSSYDLPKNAVTSVFHCARDGAISKLQGSSDSTWQIGLTKSFSPFALFWQPQTEATPDSGSGGLAQTGDPTGGLLVLFGVVSVVALALLRLRRYAP